MVGATGDDVAGMQSHDPTGELDQLRHPMFHVIGDVIVIEITIIPKTYAQLVGIGDLVRGGTARSDRGKSIEAFTHPTAGTPGPPALAAGRDIDDAGEPKHRLAPILLRDVLGWPLDHESQLCLVVENIGLGKLRQHNRVAGADDSVW